MCTNTGPMHPSATHNVTVNAVSDQKIQLNITLSVQGHNE